jgi:hypothetical protein
MPLERGLPRSPSICDSFRLSITSIPIPTYHALRQYAPVHRLADGGYFVSRYADCVALYLRLLLR